MRVRLTVARALDATNSEERALLFRRLDDADPEVREAANDSLEGYERPWWLGVFPSDPLLRMSPEQAARAAPALGIIAAACNATVLETRHDDERWARVAVAAGELPGPIAVELLARLMPVARDLRAKHVPIVRALLHTPGGFEALATCSGRRLIYRILAWRPELPFFFRTLDAL